MQCTKSNYNLMFIIIHKTTKDTMFKWYIPNYH